MLVEEHTRVIGNTVRVTVSYIREHWHEWLWIYVSEEYACPRFYLPVYKNHARFGYVAWIIPLAPLVLVAVGLWRAFLHLWSDLLWAVEKWRLEERAHD